MDINNGKGTSGFYSWGWNISVVTLLLLCWIKARIIAFFIFDP
jgi:hypothetical protein